MSFPAWMGEVPRRGVSWSDLEDLHLVNSLRKGKTITCMADEHGRSTFSIICRLSQHSPQFKAYKNDLESLTLLDLNRPLTHIFITYNERGHRNLVKEPCVEPNLPEARPVTGLPEVAAVAVPELATIAKNQNTIVLLSITSFLLSGFAVVLAISSVY